MNKRINELYQKAHSIRHYDNDPSLAGNPPTVYWQGEVSAKQFAELIVQECINEVEGLQVLQSTLDWSQHWNRAIAHTALHLKEHFGVERK